MASGDKPVRVEIEYRVSRCISALSPYGRCDVCSRACPSGAIRQTCLGRPPQFDPTRCLHCGTCLSSCPFEAFSSYNFSESKAVRRVLASRTVDGGAVGIRCFLPYGEIDALNAKVPVYQLGTCLAALSPSALFDLGVHSRCVLSARACAHCRIHETAGRQMDRNIQSACDLLHDWAVCRSVLDGEAPGAPEATCGDAGEAPGAGAPGAEAPADGHKTSVGGPEAPGYGLFIDAGDENAAHRDIADLPGQEVSAFVTRTPVDARRNIHALFARRRLKTGPAAEKDDADAKLPLRSVEHRGSTWRLTVKAYWPRAYEGQHGQGAQSADLSQPSVLVPASAAVPALSPAPSDLHYAWPAHRVDTHACVGCGTCQQMCPTGSIGQHLADGIFTYRFVPGTCIDCRLCVAACPQKAISHSAAPVVYPFDPQDCYVQEASKCPRCSKVMLAGSSVGGYCHTCALELGLIGEGRGAKRGE